MNGRACLVRAAGRAVAIAAVLGAGLVAAVSTAAAQGQTVEQFYKGKEVKVIISGAPASDYDMYARLITKLMTKYLPGNPIFVPQNMVGGGHLTATNYLYNIAAKDGSVIGGTARNIPYAALLKDPNVRYDPVKFNWLGNPEVSAQICGVIEGAQVQKAEDLFEKEMLIGGAGAASTPSQSALLFSRLLGMKFKLVDGYKSVPDVSLAMMRREVEAVCQSLNALQGGNLQGWIADGRLKVLFNFEKEPIKGVKGLDAPSIYKFAKTDEQRQILDFYTSGTRLGRPMLAPPDVPADRIAALRKAFVDAVKDPQLDEEVTKVGGQLTLVTGEEVQKIVTDIMKTPVELAKKVEQMTSAK